MRMPREQVVIGSVSILIPAGLLAAGIFFGPHDLPPPAAGAAVCPPCGARLSPQAHSPDQHPPGEIRPDKAAAVMAGQRNQAAK